MIGKIIKGISGFYYVESEQTIYECKARGVFRNRNEKPLVGDFVEFKIVSEDDKKGNIERILDRKSLLKRPEVSNVDQALIVFSSIDPFPDIHLLNRFLVSMEYAKVKPYICINKDDLKKEENIPKIFKSTPYKVLILSVKENRGLSDLKELLNGKTTALSGPSGVGKSSIINKISGKELMEVGDISRKIKRGKNTTRHTFLITLWENTYILDTPGFLNLDVPDIEKEDLQYLFPEFNEFIGQCRFRGCLHKKEPNCAIKEAAFEGKIAEERYDDYVVFLDEILGRKKF